MAEVLPDELLEPLKLYKYELAYKHQDNIDAYFNELTQKSGVDVEGNRATCKQYYEYLATLEALKRKLGGQQGLRGFFIFLTILGFLAGTICVVLGIGKWFGYPQIFIPVGVVLILMGIAMILINVLVTGKKIERIQSKIAEVQPKADEKLALAKSQMECLNNLYDWGIPSKLMAKTTPIIKMDENFNVYRLANMIENYGFKANDDENCSTTIVQSGTLIDNPFLYERDYIMHMYQKMYTGSITIHWTTLETDSKGNTHTVHHTETLTATIYKPAAGYFHDTVLFYCNEAAPRLKFSRGKSNANSLNDREIAKLDDTWDKKLRKMQQDKIKTSFTPLGNSKFEGLFGAFDRNNEVEFRLLFTPLAQRNMTNLILSKTPYGDDFKFVKREMINMIRSDHAQSLNFSGNPYFFRHYDYDKAKEQFTSYNMKYFQGIFYDFMPLLSIPLYQQHKDYDYLYKKENRPSTTPYEAEVLGNYFDTKHFKPEDCETDIILKAELASKGPNGDIYNMTAHGFRLEPRVEYVSKMGGDGCMHSIAVPWQEYIPVEKTTQMVLLNVGGNKETFMQNSQKIYEYISNYSTSNDIIYQRGLLAFILREDVTSFNGSALIKLFGQKED